MRQALAGGGWISAAAGALVAFALFGSRGSSDSRLFWIGLAAVVVSSLGLASRSPRLGGTALGLLALLGAFAVWQALTIVWSILPDASWNYANRALVYLAFGVVGVVAGSTVPRRWVATALGALLTVLLLVALAAKAIPWLYGDYGR